MRVKNRVPTAKETKPTLRILMGRHGSDGGVVKVWIKNSNVLMRVAERAIRGLSICKEF